MTSACQPFKSSILLFPLFLVCSPKKSSKPLNIKKIEATMTSLKALVIVCSKIAPKIIAGIVPITIKARFLFEVFLLNNDLSIFFQSLRK
ncbi:hypothetical protein ATX02_10000 [Oenococcus oeni]|nr:hypothetical protein ATX02_10000 [Oenococcus oeni]